MTRLKQRISMLEGRCARDMLAHDDAELRADCIRYGFPLSVARALAKITDRDLSMTQNPIVPRNVEVSS